MRNSTMTVWLLLLTLLLVPAGTSRLGAQVSDAEALAVVLEVGPGLTVGEIGAGRGEATVLVATRVGPTGRVYSTELDQDRLPTIRAAVSEAGLTNVTVIEAGASSTNLPAGCCDAIFMRNVYHHFTDPDPLDRDIASALTPGGRLAVVDFMPRPDSSPPSGVPANRGGHGVTPEIVISELTAAGLTHDETVFDWPDGQGADNRAFLVLFRKD